MGLCAPFRVSNWRRKGAEHEQQQPAQQAHGVARNGAAELRTVLRPIIICVDVQQAHPCSAAPCAVLELMPCKLAVLLQNEACTMNPKISKRNGGCTMASCGGVRIVKME